MTTSPLVMIVDDDVPLRTAFARALTRAGYAVVATTGSLDVLDVIAARRPALMLLDNHMPGATGIELIKAIRQDPSLVDLPIVLISGSSIQGEIDEAMKSGASDFRRKPVDLADLITTVETALESSTPHQAATQGSQP